MLVTLTREEAFESRLRLINIIAPALMKERPNGYPGNFELYNALLRVVELWESRSG